MSFDPAAFVSANSLSAPDAAPDFDADWYLQAYPDVQRSGMDAWTHYDTSGRAEGRLGAPVLALELDHMLWRGFAAEALPRLRALLAGGAPREAAVAGWVLARWEAASEAGADESEQGMAAAYAAISAFHARPEGPGTIRHAGPYLLGVRLALQCGARDVALEWLGGGIARFGLTPDFTLARLLCDSALGAADADLSVHLGRLYRGTDLAGVCLRDGSGARFDRLQGVSEPHQGGPLVSVIMPVFNAEAGLGHALDGLCAQSWRNLEIIVIDDGSTDGSRGIAQARAAHDGRIRLIVQDHNAGAYVARNAGMAAARGAFLTVHDADDWAHPAKIAAQAQALVDDPALKASVSHWVRAGDDLDMTGWRMEQGWIHRNVSSLMIRAELRETLGFWDRVRANADTEYYYRLIAAYGAQAIKEVHPGIPLGFGRTSPGSLTGQSETHLRTQLFGVRRDYMQAAHAWHLDAHRPGDPASLFLAQTPDARPFLAPAALRPADPPGPPTERDIIAASTLFDAQWYRLSHADVLRGDHDPALHYLRSGAAESLDPGPGFSTGGYRIAQGLDGETVPLLHWESAGRAAGAAPLPVFTGALQDEDAPRVLLFGHQAGQTLFGAERSLLDMLRRMAAQGLAPVTVLPALRNPAYLEQVRALSHSVELLPQLWRSGLYDTAPATVDAIRAMIVRHKAKAVHVNTAVLRAPLLAARAERCPSVVHVRELPAEDAALCRNLGMDAESLRRDLLAEADRFVANSEPVARWLDCPERTEIRLNSVDPALFEMDFAPESAPKGPLRVALVSSNIAKKGIADFIDIAARVEAAGAAVRFVLIGPATAELHHLRPWPGNVSYAGYAAGPGAAMAQADVVMSLSHFAESFGRTVLEAMAAGRPVICYDRGAPPSLVQSGTSGFVVPAGDRQAAANAVLALDAARGGLLRMGGAARARARQLQAQSEAGESGAADAGVAGPGAAGPDPAKPMPRRDA